MLEKGVRGQQVQPSVLLVPLAQHLRSDLWHARIDVQTESMCLRPLHRTAISVQVDAITLEDYIAPSRGEPTPQDNNQTTGRIQPLAGCHPRIGNALGEAAFSHNYDDHGLLRQHPGK